MKEFETLAVGFFDGVHLGHQKILRGASAVLTFRNHPLELLAPERAPRLIMPADERLQTIRACGVEHVTMLEFTREVADLSPSDFLSRHVFAGSGTMKIRCGENWRFGKGGAGDAAFARNAGVEVEIVPYAEFKGERISSTRIRMCLNRGEIEDANAMMGRRFKVRGQRSEGKGLGRELGYPTINILLTSHPSPLSPHPSPLTSRLAFLPHGVYEVEMNGGRGIANYGVAPTMGDGAWREPVLEVHLLDPQPSTFNLQPSSLTSVEIVRFIRPERKFASVDELKRQIAADCMEIRKK